MFKNFSKIAAMASAALAAAGSAASKVMGGFSVLGERLEATAGYSNQTVSRYRGHRNLSWAQSKKTYGITRSPSGYRNKDNPAGTKLGRQAAKGMLTKNQGR